MITGEGIASCPRPLLSSLNRPASVGRTALSLAQTTDILSFMMTSDNRFSTTLETILERLIEGVFTGIFQQRGDSMLPDITLQIGRALYESAQHRDNGIVLPSDYVIRMSPVLRAQIAADIESAQGLLADHIVALANLSGYGLHTPVRVTVAEDSTMPPTHVIIGHDLEHTSSGTTAHLPILSPATSDAPQGARLILNGGEPMALTTSLITIGRSLDNTIVLEDRYTSRQHAQIRLRFGRYTLFDAAGRSSLKVNGVRIVEHRLQSGDVITIGKSRLLYLDDDAAVPLTDTQFPPIG